MERLNPLTAGFDWEMGVLRAGLGCADERVVEGLVRRVQASDPAVHPGREWKYLEQRSGITRCFDEVLTRAEAGLRAALEACAAEQVRLAPLGMSPGGPMNLGCHVHVGCLFAFAERQAVANRLIPYLPAFLALTVHSPFAAGQTRRYKSYRTAWQRWELGPVAPIAADTAFEGCWGDLCSDRDRKPTLEVRVADSFGSARLLAEYVAFLAGFVSVLADSDDEPDSPHAVYDNRSEAIEHGLQATFVADGHELPVTELLGAMLERARPGLERFGAAGRLELIPRMLERRFTQADLLLRMAEWYDDPLVLADAAVHLLREPTAFEQALPVAPTLPAVPRRAPEERLWACIGRRTHLDSLRAELRWPPALIEQRVAALEAEGKVRVETEPLTGWRVSRAA